MMEQEPDQEKENKKVDQITVLIHGTFANPTHPGAKKGPDPDKDEPTIWWKLSEEDSGSLSTTADFLHDALGKDGGEALADTVWRPVAGLEDADGNDLNYRSVAEWTGNNIHSERLAAGKELRTQISALATALGHEDGTSKLAVNYVAHSHGGNVVLESLREEPPPNVEVRSVNLLGTPLVWSNRDPRALYIALISLWTVIWIEFVVRDWQGFWEELLTFAVMYWLFYGVIEVIRWLVGRARGEPVYGPKPEDLPKRITAEKVVLHIGEQDEADLMMHLGAAPSETYRAAFDRPWFTNEASVSGLKANLRAMFVLPLRVFETLVIRPVTLAVVAPLTEVLLEKFALGFGFRDVLLRNHGMVTYDRPKRYDPGVERQPWTAKQLRDRPALPTELLWEEAKKTDDCRNDPKKRKKLLREVTRKELRKRIGKLGDSINLTHSDYYQSRDVIEAVAKRIEDAQPGQPKGPVDQDLPYGASFYVND